MSKTIDQRIVEMRFDNKHFESNVQTSLSTLDKLKQSLNFKGATQGLENINAATKSFNLNGIGTAVETVQAKFSALEVMGVTALANITNSAVNAGKRMISALTIDPVKTGFSEYETQINSVQTILANTQHAGTNIDDVNKALDELNKYADETIYNFTEMTRNIGTFTAAGVDLETSVSSIKGIANLAAVSGSTSQQASTAMYQLSQALAAGKVSLMDWNSVVNAGMGGKVFQDALTRTSELLGTGAKAAIDTYGSFRESLTKGEWLTTEVLTETLKQFAGAYTEADLIAQGFTESQAKEIAEMAKTAESAATDVKTFTQLWDVMKESAQSGWSQTWKLLIGDMNDAKALLSPIAEFFTGKNGLITKMSDFRNKILGGALANPFGDIGIDFDKILGATDKVTKALDSYEEIVNRIIGGEFGNGQERWDKLAEAGYDWAHAQNLVNEKLGDSTRHATNYKEAQEGVTETQAKSIEQLLELTDAELKNLGLKDDEIKALRELEKYSEKTGYTVEELVKNIDLLNGRSLLIDGFTNIGKGILEVFSMIKDAWQDIFPPKSIEERSQSLYDLVAAFRKLSTHFTIVDKETGELTETGEKLQRIFKGVFAAIDIVTTILGGGFKIAFKFVQQLLSYFNVDILELLANIGDAIVKFDEWINQTLDFSGIIEFIGPYLKKAADATVEWFKSLKDSETLKIVANYLVNAKNAVVEWITSLKDSTAFGDIVSGLKDLADAACRFLLSIKNSAAFSDFLSGLGKTFTDIREWIAGVKDAENIPQYIIEGLINGLKNGVVAVGNAAIELAKGLWEAFCNFLEIDSPSKKFIESGEYIIDGLLIGLQNGITKVVEVVVNIAKSIIEAFKGIDFSPAANAVSGVWDTITGFLSSFWERVVEFVKAIDWDKIISILIVGGLLATIKKIADVLSMFAKPLDGLGEMFEGIGKAFEGLGTSFKASAVKKLSQSILLLSIAVLILASIEVADLAKAGIALVALVGIIAALVFVSSKLDKLEDFGKNALSLLGVTAAVLIIALAFKALASIELDKVLPTIGLFASAIVGLIAIVASYGLLVKGKAAQNIDKAGITILKIALALGLMVIVMKLISKLDGGTIAKGVAFMAGFVIFVAALVKVTKSSGKNIDKVGSMILKLTIALGLMVLVVKLISKLSWSEMGRGAIGMLGFIAFVGLLVKVTRTSDKEVSKIGGTLLAISASMLILVGVIKLIGNMSWSEIGKGIAGVAALSLLMAGLILVIRKVENSPKMAGTLLAMSAAIGVLAIVAVALSFVSISGLAKGIVAVGLLAAIMSMMIKAASGLKGGMGTVIALVVAIGILTGAVAVLSFIDTKSLYSAIGAISIVMAMFALLIASTGKAGTMKAGQLIGLIAIVAVLTLIVAALIRIKSDSALENVGALSILLLAFAASLFIISKAGASVSAASKAMLPMLGVVLVLAIILGTMSALDVEASIPTAAAMSVLLLAMSSALVIASKAGVNASKASVALILMGVVVGELALILGLLSYFNVEPSIATAGALSVLLLAMSAALVIASKAGAYAVSATVALMLMGVVVAEIALVLGALAYFDVEPSIATATALSVLLLAMSAALVILNFTGPQATAAVPVMMLLGIVVGELAVILGLMAHFDVNPSIETAASLSLLLISMSASLVLLGVVGAMGPAAFIGIGALATLIAGIGGLIIAIGALVDKFPVLETFLDTGIPIIEKIGYAIGSFFGNIVGGFLGNLTSGLPDMATDLSNFMTNLQPFIEGSKNIDSSVITGIGYLSGAIIALSVADLIQGITSFLQFGSSLSELGTELSMFMTNAMPFIMGAATINPEMLAGVKTLAGVILTLTAADILEGIASWFTGGSSLASFGAQLPQFGADIAAFAANLGTFDDSKTSSVTCACNAIKSLATAANSLPNEGGWLAKLVGDNSLSTFGSYLPELGTHLSSFVANLGTFSEDQVTTVTSAANAIKNLAKAANEIPNEGGWASKILGDNSIATFGSKLPELGTCLAGFVANLGTFSDDQVKTVDCAAKAVKALAKAANEIPNEGGWAAKILGDNSLATFGSKLPELGTNLAGFVTNLGTFSDDQVATVTCASNAIKAMADAASNIDGQADWAKKLFGDNSLASFGTQLSSLGTNLAGFASNLGTFTDEQVATVTAAVKAVNAFAKLADTDLKGAKKNLEGFGDKMVQVGKDIKSFTKEMPGAETLDGAVKKVDKILKAIKDISGADPDIAVKFTESLSKIGKDAVKKFVEAFTNNGAKEDVKSAAAKLMDKVSEGAESKKGAVTKALNTVATGSVSGIKDAYQSFYDAGSYLVDGLSAGISENSYKASAKASAMAKAAAKAAEDALDINSPSKVFRRIGFSVPEGFAQGIEMMSGAVKESTVTMTDSAVLGVSDSITKIADAINADIDAQPTIRPILDLSEIESGASTIGDIIGGTSSVGVLSKVGAISTMMNRRNQNGANAEVVSAIESLRKDLGNVGGTTYNSIAGITYDESSSVAAAIELITREAIKERRM